jgi:hypothetical protein
MAKSFGLREFARGFKEAIVDPIAEDWEKGYWQQRAVRARYPGADGVLNFTPVIGAVTAVDDVARDVVDTGTVSGENLAELALNRTAMGKYGRGAIDAVKRVAKSGDAARLDKRTQELKEAGWPSKGTSPRSQAGASLGAAIAAPVVATPAVGYVQHYVNKQQEANAKYGDMPIKEIAAGLRRNRE